MSSISTTGLASGHTRVSTEYMYLLHNIYTVKKLCNDYIVAVTVGPTTFITAFAFSPPTSFISHHRNLELLVHSQYACN